MWSDTTARNRAHQRFGHDHYQWLLVLYALPWLALAGAAFALFGPGTVVSAVAYAFEWAFADTAHTVPTLLALAVVMFLLKRRWRRNNYRP